MPKVPPADPLYQRLTLRIPAAQLIRRGAKNVKEIVNVLKQACALLNKKILMGKHSRARLGRNQILALQLSSGMVSFDGIIRATKRTRKIEELSWFRRALWRVSNEQGLPTIKVFDGTLMAPDLAVIVLERLISPNDFPCDLKAEIVNHTTYKLYKTHHTYTPAPILDWLTEYSELCKRHEVERQKERDFIESQIAHLATS
jgi:hypothetical protein